MTHNYAGRKPMFVEDNPDLKIWDLECVPMNRPKGSWTNGIKAYVRGSNSEPSKCVGWFFPPRIRNKGHKARYGRSRSNLAAHLQEEE
jgi:hypothetical protein